jgi:signal transduction histidine kinase/ActR/RegA family two-component response regulator
MRPMKLRSHLLVLTLGTLLPMVVFALIALGLLAERERTLFERGARERAHALLSAVDGELGNSITTLQALAASRDLDEGALREFHRDAMRVLPTQPGWTTLALATPAGEQLLRVPDEFGEKLPTLAERKSFEQVLRSAKPVIRPLARDAVSGRHEFGARVPVVRFGAVKYVLSVTIDPRKIRAMLDAQRLPPDWVGVVIDQERHVVAQTNAPESALGQPAPEVLRPALEGPGEGWFQSIAPDAGELYTASNRSGFSGWTVAMSMPAAAVEAGLGKAAWTTSLGVIVALAAALLLAAGLSHRIAAPISALASVAKAMTAGQQAELPNPGGVTEIREVGRALVDAANTARTREHALRTADRTKDEFLAMLSHELRNPLGALAGAAHLLRQLAPKDETAIRATDIVGRQVQHMTRLVEDLLDVSRVTRGKISLSREPLDLARAVESVAQQWRSAGRLAKHEVRVELSSAWVRADTARIEQIISNLFGNAVKYTPEGGTVTITVRRERNAALLQVRDTGMGMSPDLAGRVFDLFVQGERSLDRSLGGLGIGLTLVKRLAELHGGTVAAASDGPGMGSVFSVSLPVIEAPMQAAAPPAAAESPRRLHKILLIEDNDDARRTLSLALQMSGHQVYAAPDGQAGIETADAVDPEVAVIDIGLPGINGYQVGEDLRRKPAHESMVLIALTGYGQPDSLRRARDAGFDEYITKPIEPDRLMRLIDVACAAKARRRDASQPPV